jgi:ATP-dependent exoDNAse (exonuclease V) beta subunit
MKDVPDAVVAEGLREYEQWRASREEAIARGSIASLAVRTATEWASADLAAGEPAAAAAALGAEVQRGLFDEETVAPPPAPPAAPDSAERDVAVVDARGRERPGGARFGELVHAMLAAAPLDAAREAIASLADVHGRILSAPDDEIAAAIDTVQRVLAHELLGRARAAEARHSCRRETPVTCVVADGTMIEGIVDLAFEEGGAWTVVDYKTDRELAALGEDRYRRQIALYVKAIAQATAQPAHGVLVRV